KNEQVLAVSPDLIAQLAQTAPQQFVDVPFGSDGLVLFFSDDANCGIAFGAIVQTANAKIMFSVEQQVVPNLMIEVEGEAQVRVQRGGEGREALSGYRAGLVSAIARSRGGKNAKVVRPIRTARATHNRQRSTVVFFDVAEEIRKSAGNDL